VLSRNTTFTLTRDGSLGLHQTVVTYYDGQGFMVPVKSKIKSAKQLKGQTVCVQSGTTTEKNLTDFSRANNLGIKPVAFEKVEAATGAYFAGRCVAYTTDASGLAASRATMPDAENHIILPEIISKEPLGPVVRHGDNNWGDVVRWTYYALLVAEEKGITAANIEEVLASTADEEVKRLLGASGDMGAKFGLDNAAFKNAIAAVGNYGEIFARNIGEGTSINLARGLNALWTQGGLQYAPPFR